MTSADIEASMRWQAEKRGKLIPSPEEKVKLMDKVHALGHFTTEVMF